MKADIARGSSDFAGQKLFGIVRELSTPEIEFEGMTRMCAACMLVPHSSRLWGWLPMSSSHPLAQEAHRITLSGKFAKHDQKRTAYAVSSGITMCSMVFFQHQRIQADCGDRWATLALIEEELRKSPEVQEQSTVPTKAIKMSSIACLGDRNGAIFVFRTTRHPSSWKAGTVAPPC